MKKGMATVMVAMALSAAFAMTASAGWKKKESGYRYENEDGFLAANGWQQIDGKWYFFDGQGMMKTNAWIGNYWVGADGSMQTDTLAPGGYWLDGSGLASEEKRIYGDCLFVPTSYQVIGDKIMIRGDIGDTGYASQEYIDSLEIGDTIAVPGDRDGRMWHFNAVDEVTDIQIRDGRKMVYSTESSGDFWDSIDYYAAGYAIYSDCVVAFETGSMEIAVERLIQKDVLLVADKDTKFTPLSDYNQYEPKTLRGFLESIRWEYPRSLKIQLTGDHIDQADDHIYNYAG